MQPKESVVLLPLVGMGHLIPMVELAKLFIDQGFSVTIVVVVVEPPSDASTTSDPFISRVSSDYPSISFHRLPKVVLPATSNPSVFPVFEIIRLASPHLLDFLRSTSNVRALVLDMFCTPALDVADELGLPSYFFFSSSASTLAAFLFFPTLHSKLVDGNFSDLGSTPVHFPGLPPVPASDLIVHMQERGMANEVIMLYFKPLPRAKGIMVNTLEGLEKRAINALANGVCLPDRTTPPVYCIGPLVANGSNGGSGEGGGERHECLMWLDAQPEKSVVFLCFGSLGSFSAAQLKEMAIGLERSGQQFLWVVRSPPQKDEPAAQPAATPEPDLEAILPEGFLERTKGKGMVVKSWAPQAAVLAHKSVGGFVSHCGWNSTLEAISYGVPMIAWPLYAEQRMNKVFLVEEAKLAVAMEGYDKDIVSAEAVEKKIRWLMESADGKAMQDRAVAAKEEAVAAWKQNGSSSMAWLELVRAVRNGA